MIDDFPDIERLRLPNEQIMKQIQSTPKEKKVSSKAHRTQGEFLKGPIPLDWLGCAAKLSGKASLATALAIMFEVGRRRSQEITLTTAILERFGVNRKAKYRALVQLENAGLISVVRQPRRNPLVAVLAINDENLVNPAKQIVSATAANTNQKQSFFLKKEISNV